MPQVSFRQMKDGTREDYVLLDELEEAFNQGLVDRLMQALRNLENTLSGYQVSRLEHSLQTAARAEADGVDDDMIVGALLHDLGDELAPYNHSQLAASIIRPYVRAEVDLGRCAIMGCS
jgi:Predicted HD phosphohydrolase